VTKFITIADILFINFFKALLLKHLKSY